jgi:hypothetical protein
MRRDLLDVAQLTYNGEEDIIIFFPFSFCQSNRLLLEGRTWVFFRGVFLKGKTERKENRQKCDPRTSDLPPTAFIIDELNLNGKTGSKRTDISRK